MLPFPDCCGRSSESYSFNRFILDRGSSAERDAIKIGEDLWVMHAFQKKSETGAKTPKQDIDLIRARINRVKEQLQ